MNTLRKTLLALALLAGFSTSALAVCGVGAGGCFWVGGAGTWDASTTTHWASTTGGVGGVSVPISTSPITFDGASGGGTVTFDTTINSATFASITSGAHTGTLDLNANTISLTMASWNGSGTGARTILGGTGTITLTDTISSPLNFSTITNLTNPTTAFAGNTIVFSGAGTNARFFNGGGLTYGTVNISPATYAPRELGIVGNNTFANLSITNIGQIQIANTSTQTITGSFSNSGNFASQMGLMYTTETATISVAGSNTLNFMVIQNITKTGAGSITANNSFSGGGNTSITINNPVSTKFIIGG